MEMVAYTHSAVTIPYEPAEIYQDNKTGITVSAVYPAVADSHILHMVGGKEYYGLLLTHYFKGEGLRILSTSIYHIEPQS